MSEPGDRPEVHYYTDLLCVWAWIAQPRLEEVASNWGERIQIRHLHIGPFHPAASIDRHYALGERHDRKTGGDLGYIEENIRPQGKLHGIGMTGEDMRNFAGHHRRYFIFVFYHDEQ